MNKKFSTLVAALLVSGVSYAVVGTFNSPALTNSPIAKAAAANVNVSLRATAQPVVVVAQAYNGLADVAAKDAAQMWVPEFVTGSSTNFYLKNATSSYMATKAYDSKIYIVKEGEADYTKVEFKLATGGALQTQNNQAVVVTDNGLEINVAGTAVSLFQNTTAAGVITAATSLNQTASYYLAENLKEASTLGTASVGNAVQQAAPAALTFDLSSSTSTDISALNGTPSKVIPVQVPGTENYVLQIQTTEKATPLYYKATGGALSIVSEMPTGESSFVTLETGGKVQIGGLYLKKNGTAFALDMTDPTNNAVYFVSGDAALTAATAVLTATDLPTAQVYMLSVPEANASDLGTNSFSANAAVLTTTGSVPTFANISTAKNNIDANQKWSIVPTTGGFYITDGIFYLTGDAAATTGTAVTMAVVPTDESVWTLEDGAIRQLKAATYLIANMNVANAGNAAVADRMHLYAAPASSSDFSAVRPTTTTPDAKGTYVITKAETAAADLTSTVVDVRVVTAEESTIDVPTGDVKSLKDGYEYFIAEGNNYLQAKKTTTNNKVVYSLVSDTQDESDNSQLWTVTAHSVKGQQTYYSFANKLYTNVNLAFNVEYNEAKNSWTPEFAVDGEYDQFFINDQGQVTFTAKAKNEDGTEVSQAYVLDCDGSGAWTAKKVDATVADKFDFKEVSVDNFGIPRDVDYLNVDAGTGKGFGVIVKNKVGDEIKVLDVESNPFSDADLITAVNGMKIDAFTAGDKTYEAINLASNMYLRVAGSYSANLPQNNNDQKIAKINAFRSSTFIVADTLAYSAIIGDKNSNKFVPYTTVKGSELLSELGGVLTADYTYNENDFKVVTNSETDKKEYGKMIGVTRRMENAVFAVKQAAGAGIKDPAYFTNATIILPNEKNVEGIVGQTEAAKKTATVINNTFIAVKEFGKTGSKKYYVGAAENNEDTPRWNYVYLGLNNNVTYKDVNGIVNIVSRNYRTNGQIYANTDLSKVGLVQSKFVNSYAPEGQFLVTGGVDGEGFTFVTREYGTTMTKYVDDSPVTSFSLKTVPGKENVYSMVGFNDTIEIVSAAKGEKTIGYKVYNQKKDLDNKIYNLSLNVNVAGLPAQVYVKEAHSADHSLAFDADSLNAVGFKLIKLANAADADHQYGDSIFVSVDREYSYIGQNDAKEDVYKTAKDTVVAFTYAIYNSANNEFVNVKEVGNKTYFYCNPNLKYNANDNAATLRSKLNAAQKFILKEKNDGKFNLIAMSPYMTLPQEQQIVFNAMFKWNYLNGNTQDNRPDNVVYGKLYSGLTEDKVDYRGDIYETTYNDLFSIEEVNAPKYLTIDAAPFDTVRIYKEGMDNVALYAETADKAIVSGNHFLGMTHNADKDLKKTMFSFFVDTAYVNRAGNYKPQYMLVIDADTLHSFEQCPIPSHGVEDTGRIDTVTGKFLTTMVDSIPAWGDKHNNPYWWEKEQYPRLGFVNAKHIGDELIIVRDNGIQSKADTINLANNDDKTGVFAFRIVDQNAKSFLMETKGGWIKWLNGVPVVVSDIEQAEVFNFEATTNNPTANENAPEVSSISVIATNGAVIIKGAAGKKVAITNVLGQTIANTVLSSSEATIAAPAGIVVVAVEGEAAVKAIVK